MILGTFAGGIPPRTDYNQKDPAKADYLIGREEIENHIEDKGNPHGVTAAQVGAVPKSRKVNNKALSADITLTANDVGAKESTWTPSAKELLAAYPVGSIYLAVNNTSPASLFGGTWTQLKDRFLLGAGSSYTNGSTGGASTVTLTVDQMPKHGHVIYDDTDERLVGPYGGGDSGSHGITYSHTGRSNTLMASDEGGGKSHNNMPPYLVVYMWKRTA